MAWDIGDILKGIFGSNAPQQVQPINPNTAPGQPPSLGGAPIPAGGGSGIGGTTPAPNASTAAPAAGQLPSTVNIPGMGNIALPQQSFLDNPLLHGLLAMYGGFAGSPRREGLGGAIKSALGGGMTAYDAARAAQLTPYKTLAELEKAGAETGLAKARTKEADIAARGAESIGAANQLTGAAMLAHANSLTDPIDKEMWTQAAHSVSLNTHNVVDFDHAFALGTKLAEQKHLEAQTGLEQEQTKTEGAKQKELGARAGEETAGAGLKTVETAFVAPLAQATIGEKGAQQKKAETETLAMPQVNQARIALDNVNTALKQAQLPGEATKRAAAQATVEKNLRTAYAAQQHIGESAWNDTIGVLYPGAKFGQSYEDFKQSVLGAGSVGAGVVANHPALPAGWKQDPNNPNGAWDDKGMHHTYVP